jgi:hypothetical protein
MLEFRADPNSPYYDKNFATGKNVLVYCASGGRSALAGKVLKDMGYTKVYNMGAFKDWARVVVQLKSRSTWACHSTDTYRFRNWHQAKQPDDSCFWLGRADLDQTPPNVRF